MGHWEIMSFWTLWHQLGLGYLKMDEHILPQPKGSFYTEITGDRSKVGKALLATYMWYHWTSTAVNADFGQIDCIAQVYKK